ncbi:hypothetical protein POTOM_058472 [Populus tomentosa]|uniref:Uncharacterized protein n=1 Tax=Populus tomentosa TaxID=118781 RepID=A0A8X8C3Z8_POPTO|nr:hypothetical protein POTOM_058472 [Populus tomentosa]
MGSPLSNSVLRKASLLAGGINHLKELRKKAAEGSEGLFMPLDVDEELSIRVQFAWRGSLWILISTKKCMKQCIVTQAVMEHQTNVSTPVFVAYATQRRNKGRDMCVVRCFSCKAFDYIARGLGLSQKVL